MRMLLVSGLVGALAAFIMPASTMARDGYNCDYASSQSIESVRVVDTGSTGNQVYFYAGHGVSGDSSVTAVGVCVNLTNAVSDGGANRLDGGTAEAGITAIKGDTALGPGPGVYAILDGDNDNATSGVNGIGANGNRGYVGISNVETGTSKAVTCNGTSSGNGSNSGGCVGLKTPGQQLPIPLIVCGNTSGDQWESSASDGCLVPD